MCICKWMCICTSMYVGAGGAGGEGGGGRGGRGGEGGGVGGGGRDAFKTSTHTSESGGNNANVKNTDSNKEISYIKRPLDTIKLTTKSIFY